MIVSQRPVILYWSSIRVDHVLFANPCSRFPCRNTFVILRLLLPTPVTFRAGRLMIPNFEADCSMASRALRYTMLGSIIRAVGDGDNGVP